MGSVDASQFFVSLADLNGDSISEIFAYGNTGVDIFPGQGNFRFGPATVLEHNFVSDIQVDDFDSDGSQDVIMSFGDSIAVVFGQSDGSFGNTRYFMVNSTPTSSSTSFTISDFDNDGYVDCAAASSDSTFNIWLNDGSGNLETNTIVNMPISNTLGSGISKFLNSDSIPDILWRGSSLSVLAGTGISDFELLHRLPIQFNFARRLQQRWRY